MRLINTIFFLILAGQLSIVFGCKSAKEKASSDTSKERSVVNTNTLGCISGDCVNGTGTMIYAIGLKYVGEFKDGLRDGMGSLDFPNGDNYTGAFKQDKRSGQGKYSWASGDFYAGDFKNSQLSGNGVYTFQSGGVYDGSFIEDGNKGKGSFLPGDSKSLNCELESKKVLCDSTKDTKATIERRIQAPVTRKRFEGNK